MNELKPNGLVSGNGIKQTTDKELKPNGLVSANNYVGETINSVDANNDGMFDVRDLVAAKKKQLTSSGTVRQYNDQAVGGIKDRLLNPTYSDNIRASILPRIEQLSKGQTLSEKETSELQKLLKAAKDDTELSETERSYYGNLYAKVLGGGKYSDKQDYYNAIKEAIKGPDSIAKHNYDIAKKNYEEYLKDPQKYENEWRNQHKGIPFVPPKAPQEYESVTAKGVLIGNFTHFTGHSINQIYAPNARKEGNGYAIGHSDVDGSGRLDYLTEGQAMDALYLFETTKGNYSDKTKAVWDYLNSEEIKNGLGQQYYASEMEKAKEAFNESSFVEKVGLNIASVISNVYGSMVYAGKTIAEQIKETYDPYSSDNVTIQAARSLRGWQAEEIENAVKGDNSKFRDFLGEAAAFVYEAGMMVIDNIVGYYGFGGDMTSLSFNIGKVPFGIMPYTVSMGLGAYSDKVHEGYSKGLSKSQIVALATISGLSETLTEGFGMEQFANVVFRGKSGLLNSMFAEFSEEIVAGYLNDVADIAISGGKSEFAEKVKEYINQGYTDTKAVGRAIFDMGFGHIKEGVTAALSVGIGATPNAIIGTTTYMRYGKKANAQNNGTALRDIALTLPANSEAYKTAKKYAGDKKLSNFEIGKILIALKQELNSRIEPKIIKAIENRLVELGVEDASYKADLIFKMINLEDLSAEEKAIITNDEATKKVYTDLITEHTASEYETPDLKWIADMFADTEAERTAKTAIDMSITMPISESTSEIIQELLIGENKSETKTGAETGTAEDTGVSEENVEAEKPAEAAPAQKSESGFEEVSVKENSEPKERNTPGRINGLASPVGNLIRKGVSNDSIPNSPETGKENVDNSGDSGQTDERTAVFRSPEKIKNVSEHIVDVAKKIDKDLEIVFVDKIHNPDGSVKANANGRYDRKNNRLYLKKGIDTSTAYVELFKHELMHYLEGKKAYGDFKNYLFDNSMAFEAYCRFYVRQTVGKDFAESRDKLFNKVKESYKKKGYKPQDIEYEMVADFFKHCLLRGAEGRNQIKNTLLSLSYDKKMPAIDNETDLDIIGELAKKQTSLLQKIKDFFAGIIDRLTAKLPQFSEKRKLIEDLAYLDDRIGRVLRSGPKNETLDQADRYMLKHDNRGNEYWQIETKDDIFNGLTTTGEYQKAAFDYILNARDNNTVVHAIDGKKMKFIRLSAEEFTNSEASKDLKATDTETYKRKMRMLPSLESILLNANVNWQSPDFKNHNLFKDNGFENYRGKVRIDNIIFNTVVIAGKARFGDVFYDINLEVDQILPHGETASEIKRSTSADNSISNNSENVNENFEENSEEGDNRYSLDGEELQSEGGEDDEITYDPTWAINHNWDKAVEEYGAIKENSEIQTPKSVDGKKLVSQAVDNLLNHIRFTDEQLTAMKGSVLSGDDSYKILSDKTAENYAKKCMKEGTAVTKWNQAIQGGFVTKREIAIGIVLLKSAVEAGDIKEALEIKTALSEVATRSAQAVQAFSLVSKMSGIEKLYTMQKMVDKLNADIDERFKRKQNKPQIKINRQLAQELAKAESGENTDIITREIMLDIAKQVPPTFMDKWNTWRYFCMLFNPITHVRNFVGNCLFVPAVRVKDAIGALIESTRPEDERTKSLVIKKEYKVFAKKILKTVNVQKALGAISKYSDEEGLFKFKEAFANGIIGEKVENIPGLGRVDKTLGKTIQTGVDINSALLSLEDIWFKNLHFVHAMAGFLQARNVDLNAEIDGAVLTEATDYAVKEAMKATFNDASKLANRLSKWSSESLGADIAINSVLPFKRTPINIVKRGVEYSPIGLLKELTVGFYDLKSGNITATEFIDGLSAGISGTIPLVLGFWLASIGLANAGFGDDDEDKIKKLTGEQANSIKLFGKSYTLDWAAPACIPFFIGVTASNLKEDENLNFANSLDTIANALSPITEMSCLNGISDVINDLSYGEGGSDNWVQNLGATVISNYISQGFPTIGGKIASTIDETQRQNYYDKNNTILSKTTQETLQNIQSKIPGLSSKRIEKVDAWGRTVKTENVGERAIQNFISPGKYKATDYNDVNNEIKRLFYKTGEARIPSTPQKYFEYNGKRKDLTAEEYVQVEKYMGQGKFGIVSEMIKSEKYKTLSDEEKSLAIKRAYDYVNARVKKEYTGAAMYKWQEIVNEKYDFIKEPSSKNYRTIAEVIIGRVISEK